MTKSLTETPEQREQRTARERRRYHARKADPTFMQRRRATQRKWVAKNPHYWVTRRYDMTGAQYEALLEEQDGRCAICRRPFTDTPHLDHDHESGLTRSLLCRRCNVVVGAFEGPLAAAAVKYIDDWKLKMRENR